MKQVAVNRGVSQWQLIGTGAMQSHINPVPCRIRVGAEGATKWIKRSGWVRIQQRIAQPGRADVASGQLRAFVARVTKTGFPAPRLKVIAKLSHLAFHSHVEEVIPEGNLVASRTGVLNSAKLNARGDRHQFPTGSYP